MNISDTLETSACARRVWFDDEYLWLLLTDGRKLAVPLTFFPRLLHATPRERAGYEMSGRGTALHWDELDEDISVAGLLLGKRDETVLGRGLITIEEARRRSKLARAERSPRDGRPGPKPRRPAARSRKAQ